MVRSVDVVVDFYEVRLSDRQSLRAALELLKRKRVGERNQEYGATTVQLNTLSFSRTRSAFEGDFLRISFDNHPNRATLQGRVTPLDLVAEEGLEQGTAFLYDPATKILALQRNRLGVTPTVFRYYMSEAAGVALALAPVVDGTAMQRFRNLTAIRKFEVSMAVSKLPDGVRASRPLRDLIQMTSDFEARNVVLTLSVGHAPPDESLLVRRVRDVVDALGVRSDEDEAAGVKRVRVHGGVTASDGEIEPTDPVDLLFQKIESSKTIQVRREHASYEQRIGVVRRCFEECSHHFLRPSVPDDGGGSSGAEDEA